MNANREYIKIAGIVKNSVVDGPGIRYVIFTQGCHHNCDGCQNPQTHDPNGGTLKSVKDIYEEIIHTEGISGVTFSGGEPFLQAEPLSNLAYMLKQYDPEMSIICYTGYTYEELTKIIKEQHMPSYLLLLCKIDYLIDGRFEKDKASLDCKWRGSTNQRIIDVDKSTYDDIKEIEI